VRPSYKFNSLNDHNTYLGLGVDLVVLEFEKPFNLSSSVAPACLPTKEIAPGSDCYASGWGSTNPWVIGTDENSSYPAVLKAVKLKISSADECEDSYHSYKYNETYIKDSYNHRCFKI